MVVNIHDPEFGDRASCVTSNCKKKNKHIHSYTDRDTHIQPHTTYFITVKSFVHQKTQNGKATCKPYTQYYSSTQIS